MIWIAVAVLFVCLLVSIFTYLIVQSETYSTETLIYGAVVSAMMSIVILGFGWSLIYIVKFVLGVA